MYKYLFETLFWILSGLYPELELVEHGNSILSFWGTVILFSKVAVPFHIPTNSSQMFQFLHILASAYYSLSF